MKTVLKKSALPLYVAAACWLVYALLFPLYKLWHFLPPAAISVAAYFISSKFFKPISITVEDRLPRTGNEAIDNIVEEHSRYVSELRRLNMAIEDNELSMQIERMENTSRKIINYIVENPKKAPQIRRFMNYYLPTAIDLLHSYEIADAQEIKGANIEKTMRSVHGVMGTIADAFDKQLDNLFKDVVLDISTDITVLERLLEAEGLNKDGGKENG